MLRYFLVVMAVFCLAGSLARADHASSSNPLKMERRPTADPTRDLDNQEVDEIATEVDPEKAKEMLDAFNDASLAVSGLNAGRLVKATELNQ